MSIRPTSAKRFQLNIRRGRALELRIAGRSQSEIGDELGVARKIVAKDLTAALVDVRQWSMETAGEVLAIEVAKLDALHAALWPYAIGGQSLKDGSTSTPSDATVDRVLRIAERRSRLLGLDAPVKRELSGPDGGAIEIDSTAEAQAFMREAMGLSDEGNED